MSEWKGFGGEREEKSAKAGHWNKSRESIINLVTLLHAANGASIMVTFTPIQLKSTRSPGAVGNLFLMIITFK